MNTLVEISYHGRGFHGCPEVEGHRTVLGELRVALGRIGQEPVTAECLSRTDAGVHACGNVALVRLPRPVAPGALLAALDRHLPWDLRPVGVAEVDEPPRVISKRYTYHLDLSPFGDPLRAPFSWLPGRLDPARLPALTQDLVGTRDFVAFRRRGETRASLVRRVDQASWTFSGQEAIFSIEGEGFGYHLVRALVGAMVRVARGGAEAESWRAALSGVDQDLARETAPARGLVLQRLVFDPPPDWVRVIRPG